MAFFSHQVSYRALIIGGGAGGGAEWAVAPHLQTRGANGIKCPPPFRRLSGMMPANTEKTWAYVGENV